MANSAAQEQHTFDPSVFPATATPTPKDRRVALVVVSISVVLFFAAIFFARVQLPEIWGFIPTYESAATTSDLVIAILLLAQFLILRFPALLVLACGYIVTALLAVAHMLTFPRLFAPTGLLGAGLQSTAWLYMFWHGVFPICVIAYTLLMRGSPAARLPRSSVRLSFVLGIAGAIAVVAALTAYATLGHALLPTIMDGNHYTPAMIVVVSAVWALSAAAGLILWLRRPHSVLDLWLMVVMLAWVLDIALSAVLNAGRFDLGFYTGRIYGFVAATFVMIMLLLETGTLYARLVRLRAAEQKERRREAESAEVALQAYAEREQLFIAAVESSNDAIVTKSLDGVITGWNHAAEDLFGYKSDEVIGKHIGVIVPDELRGDVQMILGKIKNGEKIDHHETVRITKDGRRTDVSLSVSPIKSPTGAIIGAAKVARDISARRMAQEALLESEQMARAIIDTALDAFLQLDNSGTVIAWSPKAQSMFGWPREEAIGRKLEDLLIPPENRAAYAQRIAQFLADAERGVLGRRYEASSLRRDGTQFNTEVSLTALRRRDSYIINGFIRDITEKVASEEQLRQAQKMETVGNLTGGIAHDFNNMLTVITGTIDILGDAVADKPELAAIAKLISEAADRGAELTGHLLAFARKQPLQPREIDINDLIMQSGKLLRPALGEHIEIESVLGSDVSPALVDPHQLSSALLNLAINARDAMPDGGKLTLETENVVLDESYAKANSDVQSGDYVLIAVSDNGTGIPASIRDRIFEPFFTTKEVGKGTGLGLSMVYGFIKQSGGHIKVYSEEGHGTTFKIYLPRAAAQAMPMAESTLDSQPEGGNETILVVEDDDLVRTYVIAQLAQLGYKTLSAANGAEALAIADKGAQFDLLFTDVIMPGKMNGRQLAEEMAKRRSSLKVLFTSGYTENAIIHHGRLDPGVFLLAKPYRKSQLARMLRSVLGADNAVPNHASVAPKSQAM